MKCSAGIVSFFLCGKRCDPALLIVSVHRLLLHIEKPLSQEKAVLSKIISPFAL